MEQKILDDLKQAMLNRDKLILATLRMVKSAMQLEEIEKKDSLTEDEITNIILKQIKMRKESVEAFKRAGNKEELLKQTEEEINILQNYLPKQLSEEEVIAIIKDGVAAVNAQSMRDMSAVISNVSPKLKARADMQKVSKLIKEILS